MRCLLCKSTTEIKYTNYIADLGNCIIVIHNVPTQVCSQCGEKSYSFDVSVRIQELINQVKDIVSGIAELNYSDAA